MDNNENIPLDGQLMAACVINGDTSYFRQADGGADPVLHRADESLATPWTHNEALAAGIEEPILLLAPRPGFRQAALRGEDGPALSWMGGAFECLWVSRTAAVRLLHDYPQQVFCCHR